jgi:type IV secretory pathway TraG/TraD family ATPase VirD4
MPGSPAAPARPSDPVHILDPSASPAMASAAFNPLDTLDPAGLDVAEDASTLADALVFDEPGMAGEKPIGTRKPRR